MLTSVQTQVLSKAVPFIHFSYLTVIIVMQDHDVDKYSLQPAVQ